MTIRLLLHNFRTNRSSYSNMSKTIPSFEELYLFQELFKHRSLSFAAAQRGIAPSSASYLLSHLRQIFQDDLFLKTKNGLIPTPKATSLLPPIQATLANLEEMVFNDSVEFQIIKRTIRIGCADNAPFSLFPYLLELLREQLPNVTLDFFNLPINRLHLLETAEMAFIISPMEQNLPAGLRCLGIGKHSFTLVAGKTHPLSLKKSSSNEPISDEEISEYPFIDIVYTNQFQRCILREVLFPEWSSAKSVIRTPYFLTFVRALENSSYLMILPRLTFLQLQSRYNICEIKTLKTPTEHEIKLIWHQRIDADPVCQLIRSILFKCSSSVSRR